MIEKAIRDNIHLYRESHPNSSLEEFIAGVNADLQGVDESFGKDWENDEAEIIVEDIKLCNLEPTLRQREMMLEDFGKSFDIDIDKIYQKSADNSKSDEDIIRKSGIRLDQNPKVSQLPGRLNIVEYIPGKSSFFSQETKNLMKKVVDRFTRKKR